MTGVSLCEPLSHGDAVLQAHFNPTGDQVVTASADHTAQLWNFRLPRPAGIALGNNLEGQMDSVSDARFSHDGRLVAASSGDTVRFWDAVSHQESFGAIRVQKRILCFALSPDDRLLAIGCVQGVIQVLDIATGRLVTDFSGPPETEVRGVQFSADGRRLAVGGTRGIAAIFDLTGDRAVRPPPWTWGDSGDSRATDLASNGRWWVVPTDGRKTWILDAQTGARVSTPLEHFEAISSARFSPDNRRVVTCSWAGTARVWEVPSGRPITDVLGHQEIVLCASFSPDSRQVVTGSNEGMARVWDAETGRLLLDPLRHLGPVLAVEYSSDGRRLVTASTDGTARVWDTRTGLPTSEPLRHGAKVNSARFNKQADWLLTASDDGTVRLWPLFRVASASPRWLPELAEAVGGWRLTPEGNFEKADLAAVFRVRSILRDNPKDDVFTRWATSFLEAPAPAKASPPVER